MATKELASLLVITGETASGKSALGLELAQRLNGEIICADSWTVYKGFDIGTAKPTVADQKLVRHHLLDVTTADKGFSAPQFQKLALAAIDNVSSRGKLPIMVGGAGLYIDSVVFGYGFLPAGSAAERARLDELSLAALLRLAKAKKLPLENIDTRNKRRVIRLIENKGAMPSRTGWRHNTLLLELAVSKDELVERIAKRVNVMLLAGLEGEVKQLSKRYGWEVEPMKGVGYREWQEYFSGNETLAQAREKIIKSTLDLAKKQCTWLRRPIYLEASKLGDMRNKSIRYIINRGEVDDTVELITTKLNKVF